MTDPVMLDGIAALSLAVLGLVAALAVLSYAGRRR